MNTPSFVPNWIQSVTEWQTEIGGSNVMHIRMFAAKSFGNPKYGAISRVGNVHAWGRTLITTKRINFNLLPSLRRNGDSLILIELVLERRLRLHWRHWFLWSSKLYSFSMHDNARCTHAISWNIHASPGVMKRSRACLSSLMLHYYHRIWPTWYWQAPLVLGMQLNDRRTASRVTCANRRSGITILDWCIIYNGLRTAS